MMSTSPELWLCFSGGNALGAYHVGAYSVLHEAGIYPQRIAGASVGAVVAALIAGNKPENRLPRLAEFWNVAADKFAIANVLPNWDGPKIVSSLGTILQGRPGLFAPSISQWMRRLAGLSSPALFERSGFRNKLERLVDFEVLNSGATRLIVNAVDVTTGREAVFDTAEMTITVEHLMAWSAFPILFPPEPVDQAILVDGGLASNLPILHLFRDPPANPVKCLAFDLVCPRGNVPSSIDDAVHRMQDLAFSNQSQLMIELLGHRLAQSNTRASLLHIAYNGEGEVGGKMLEFSSSSMKARHVSGRTDALVALGWLRQADAIPGLFAPRIKEFAFDLPNDETPARYSTKKI